MTFYALLIVAGIFSGLLIEESKILGQFFEAVFGLPEGVFYSRHEPLSWVVAAFQWPFMLFLIGLAVDIPSLEWDFIIAIVVGIMAEWAKYRRDPETRRLKRLSGT